MIDEYIDLSFLEYFYRKRCEINRLKFYENIFGKNYIENEEKRFKKELEEHGVTL